MCENFVNLCAAHFKLLAKDSNSISLNIDIFMHREKGVKLYLCKKGGILGDNLTNRDYYLHLCKKG